MSADNMTYIKAIAKAMDDKRAQDIEVLKVEELTSLTEYFVICTAASNTQVKAIADEVEFQLKHEFDLQPHHIEGHDAANWILLDYGFVVVHVFLPDARSFYSLEKLWKDAVPIELDIENL